MLIDWWSWNTEYKHNKNKTWGNLRTTDIKYTKGRTSPDEMEMFYMLSHSDVSQSLQLWRTVTHQAPLSMGFSRQEYWSGLPFPPPRTFLIQESNPCLLYLLHWQAHFLPLSHLGSSERVCSLYHLGLTSLRHFSGTMRVQGRISQGKQKEIKKRKIAQDPNLWVGST